MKRKKEKKWEKKTNTRTRIYELWYVYIRIAYTQEKRKKILYYKSGVFIMTSVLILYVMYTYINEIILNVNIEHK